MSKCFGIALSAAFACVCLVSMPARSATVKRSFTFTSAVEGGLSGTFSLSYDFDSKPDVVDKPLDAISFALNGKTYDVSNTAFSKLQDSPLALTIGGIGGFWGDNARTISIGVNDFALSFYAYNGQVGYAHILYSKAGDSGSGPSRYGAVNIAEVANPSSASVPEPTAWAMLIGGMASTGAMLRRRRRYRTSR